VTTTYLNKITRAVNRYPRPTQLPRLFGTVGLATFYSHLEAIEATPTNQCFQCGCISVQRPSSSCGSSLFSVAGLPQLAQFVKLIGFSDTRSFNIGAVYIGDYLN